MVLVAFILISLHCTSGVVPKTSRIEVAYIGSLLEDLNREKPISVGLSRFQGIKIAHTITKPAFMEYFLYRRGLSQLIDELEIDYLISDTIVRGQRFFSINRAAGYAIPNVAGIRFAIYSAEKESLTIEDQVQLTLIKERSDILWVLDQSAIDMEPALIKFHVDNRALSDKSISPINTRADTARHRLVREVMNKLRAELNTKIHINGSIDEYLFSTIAEKQAANIVIYPQTLMTGEFEGDSLTLGDLMGLVAFEMKFRKASHSDTEISEICAVNGFRKWGDAAKENIVLLPDGKTGKHIFDFYCEKE